MLNVPTLRFGEFDGEWVEERLGDIATFSKGKSISKSDITKDGHLECIRYGELYTVYGELIQNIKSKTNLDKSNLILSQYNDVIIPASGETQIDIATASCVLKDDVALSGDLNIIKTDKNGLFLDYYLNSNKKIDIARLSQGISVVHLYSSQLKTLKLNLPYKEEQQKIATFLTAVDQKIEQLTKKEKLLVAYKKGVMQKIFSQEIRFRGDDGEVFGDWVERKLGEVAIFFKGKGISKSDIVENGKIECIRYGELYTIYNEVISEIKSKTNLDRNNLVFSKFNDVIIPASGETQIDIATASCVLKDDVALSGDLNIIRSNENGIFLAYYLNSKMKLDIARLSQGISVVHLYSSQLKSLKLNLPQKAEQTKIANFLSSIDKKIEQVNKQIEESKSFKKGLLQQMFV
ncbi:restriction endonuclease subunit S [Sulfurovum sp. bin170]|uniref:restriction endonuclease subunit S n=1 Tax=Sulfurovum sp. bin170 TaxID=2695268 RepID=UPI0013DF48B7|nr:restriction endonuclease subunit S [Sulfurovum sp. bin170]NEW60240.1 restriction endonuclease subunit S [Sulfurovum sp. bin170]